MLLFLYTVYPAGKDGMKLKLVVGLSTTEAKIVKFISIHLEVYRAITYCQIFKLLTF